MTLDKKYIDNFINGINKGPLKKRQNLKLDIQDSDIFKEVVYQGYLDASRTFKGIKSKDTAINNLAKKLHRYFSDVHINDDFNTLHKKWCKEFISDLENDGYIASYGKAQKVINMAFKYLFCFEYDSSLSDKFKNCHMPLDSYTLNWFKRVVLNGKCHYKDTNPHRIVEWSKLDPETYCWIQEQISEHLSNEEITVLELEFVIWPEEIAIISAESLSKQLNNIKELPKHNNVYLNGLLNQINNLS